MYTGGWSFWALISVFFPSPFLLQSHKFHKLHLFGFFFLHKVPEMAEELLENSVLALYCLHNDLYHVRAVTVGVIWKGDQLPH